MNISIVLVLLSALVERFVVSRMRDFFISISPKLFNRIFPNLGFVKLLINKFNYH